jgi:DNA-binding SARP family transcriptional activator
MAELKIYLFGGFSIISGKRSSNGAFTHQTQSLFAYLILQRHRALPRDILADVFWGDRDSAHARGCLSTTLWRLRRFLEPPGTPSGTYLLIGPSGEIGFNSASQHWLDVAMFEDCARRWLTRRFTCPDESTVRELEDALQLYTGELLEGFYDEWVLRERERLRGLYLDCLSGLMRHYGQQQDYENAIRCAQKILDHDPLREEIYRELMKFYSANGQRGLAIQQYKACRKTLAAELNIEPMEETQMLYRQMTAPAISTSSGLSRTVLIQEPQSLLHNLRSTLASLDQVRQQVQCSIEQVEQLLHESASRN